MQLIKLLRIKGKVLTYNTKYSFVKLKNIDDIKKLPLDLMFNLMKEHHKKFNDLINLKPRSRENKNKRLEVITVLAIFIVNCMTFTEVNTTKK